MKIVNTYVHLIDAFSGCTKTKIITVSEPTFKKMQSQVGQTIRKFDKTQQIAFNWTIKEVRQALQTDYKNNN